MKKKNRRNKYFAEEAPLPMHMMLIEEMPNHKYSNRFRQSAAARTAYYECFTFYKQISRPLPLIKMGIQRDEEES
jgi:hypothetical protein